MKKIYLFLLIALGVFSLQAQKITLLYEEETIMGETLEIELNPEATTNMTFIHIQNDAESEVTFRIEMTPTVSEGNTVSMCFAGQCMAPTNFKSAAVTVAAGEVYTQFDLQYEYTSLEESSVLLHFIDTLTNETLKKLNVVYKNNVGLTENADDKNIKLSAVAQPNPATNNVTFNYSVPAKYKNAQLVVRNSLGSVVKQSVIKTGVHAKANVNVLELANGVYFYSIIADGATLVTKKLIVKH